MNGKLDSFAYCPFLRRLIHISLKGNLLRAVGGPEEDLSAHHHASGLSTVAIRERALRLRCQQSLLQGLQQDAHPQGTVELSETAQGRGCPAEKMLLQISVQSKARRARGASNRSGSYTLDTSARKADRQPGRHPGGCSGRPIYNLPSKRFFFLLIFAHLCSMMSRLKPSSTSHSAQNCPTCITFAAMNKLYKISSHPALLQVDPSESGPDAQKKLQFAKVALTPDVLRELPGGTVYKSDCIMDDHIKLSGKLKTLDFLLRKYFRRRNRVLVFSYSTAALDVIQNHIKVRLMWSDRFIHHC